MAKRVFDREQASTTKQYNVYGKHFQVGYRIVFVYSITSPVSTTCSMRIIIGRHLIDVIMKSLVTSLNEMVAASAE